MNNVWIVKSILKLVSGLSSEEAHSLLLQAKQRIDIKEPEVSLEYQSCPNTFRAAGRTKIDRDPEMKTFILGLPYMAQAEVINACTERFGAKRAPSRSGLNRFLMMQRAIK